MRIAIVEDNITEADTLERMLCEYASAHGRSFSVRKFISPAVFLESYKRDVFDAVFMDIEMPMMNGMEASKRLRELDESVILVFVTNMAQFAIDGYGVQALDFVVKPVNRMRLNSLVDNISKRLSMRVSRTVDVKTANSFVRLDVNRITYLEVYKHRLYYHTLDGVYDAWGSLTGAEAMLPQSFARCNNGYLVNLAFVKKVNGDEADVAGENIKISRPKKKEFLDKLIEFVGG